MFPVRRSRPQAASRIQSLISSPHFKSGDSRRRSTSTVSVPLPGSDTDLHSPCLAGRMPFPCMPTSSSPWTSQRPIHMSCSSRATSDLCLRLPQRRARGGQTTGQLGARALTTTRPQGKSFGLRLCGPPESPRSHSLLTMAYGSCRAVIVP